MDLTTYLINEALVLIPVLIILGQIIKGIEVIPNKYIPVILLLFGIGGAIALMGVSANSVIQGILVAGAAVYGNQIYKQLSKGDEE